MKAELGTDPKNRQNLYEKVPFDTPLAVDIMVSNICNFRCNYCIHSAPEEDFSASGIKRGLMEMKTLSTALEQLKEFPKKIKSLYVLGVGEPMLNPLLPAMIREIRDAGVTDEVTLITNGSRLTPKYGEELVDAGLSAIRISLQGLSSEKYWEISKAKIDWDDFYGNIVHFSKIKGECKLKVQIADTSMSTRGGDREKFFALFGDICDAVSISHIYDAHASWGKDYDGTSLVSTGKNRFGYPIRNVRVCWRPFTRLEVHPDGLLAPCCNALMGYEENIADVPMYEAWTSPTGWIERMRRDFLRHDISRYAPCKRCHFPSECYHPEDILDGHEDEILARMDGRK